MYLNSRPFTECPEALVTGNYNTIPVLRCMAKQRQVRRFDFPVLRTDTKYLCDISIRKRNYAKTGLHKNVRVYGFPFGENKVCCAPGLVKVPYGIQHVSIVERKKDAGVEQISQDPFRHSLHTHRLCQYLRRRSHSPFPG